jgi:hypothetical protein
MTERPQVIAFMVDAPIADDDPHRAIKLRAREIAAESDRREVRAAAARLEEAAGLFMADGFDPEQTWDAGLAAGLTDADLDAAAYVGLTLWQVERGTLGA